MPLDLKFIALTIDTTILPLSTFLLYNLLILALTAFY